jgi:hypothetical protein
MELADRFTFNGLLGRNDLFGRKLQKLNISSRDLF